MKHIAFFILAASLQAEQPGPIGEISRAQEINLLVHNTIKYVASPAVIKTPDQTIKTGGDCADMSAYIVWLLEEEGIHAEILLLDLEDFTSHHAIVRLWGILFDPVSGMMFTDEFPLAHKVNYSLSWKSLLVLTNWKHIGIDERWEP